MILLACRSYLLEDLLLTQTTSGSRNSEPLQEVSATGCKMSDEHKATLCLSILRSGKRKSARMLFEPSQEEWLTTKPVPPHPNLCFDFFFFCSWVFVLRLPSHFLS